MCIPSPSYTSNTSCPNKRDLNTYINSDIPDQPVHPLSKIWDYHIYPVYSDTITSHHTCLKTLNTMFTLSIWTLQLLTILIYFLLLLIKTSHEYSLELSHCKFQCEPTRYLLECKNNTTWAASLIKIPFRLSVLSIFLCVCRALSKAVSSS